MTKNISKCSFFLGFLGFLGFKGFYNDPLDFLYFAFLGYFSEFWWIKLGSFEDERLRSNRYKAGFISFITCFVIAVLITIIMSLFLPSLASFYKLQLLILPTMFSAASILWAFLTYKFDSV